MRSGIYWDDDVIREGWHSVIRVLQRNGEIGPSEAQQLGYKHQEFCEFAQNVLLENTGHLNGFPDDQDSIVWNRLFESAMQDCCLWFLQDCKEELGIEAEVDPCWMEFFQAWYENLVKVVVPYKIFPGVDPVSGMSVAPAIDIDDIMGSYGRFVENWAQGFFDQDSAWTVADNIDGSEMFFMLSDHICFDAERFYDVDNGARIHHVISSALVDKGIGQTPALSAACLALGNKICDELVVPTINEINAWR